MISTTKLIKMARKWQKLAANSRRTISWSTPVTEKGHFVIYTNDKRRFMIPLAYLQSNIFAELFSMAEEEFEVAGSRPIVLPCDFKYFGVRNLHDSKTSGQGFGEGTDHVLGYL